jgi:hypothetical protein
MFPKQLDEEAVYSGRILREGEEFGKVGSFFQHERATTYHLHFDMQVPTKYGWVFVNPYMTLVAAYERLIGGRGTQIKEEPPIVLPIAALSGTRNGWPPLPTSRPGQIVVPSEGDDRIEELNHEQPDQADPDTPTGSTSTRAVAPAAGAGEGPEHEPAVRPMGRRFSRESARTGSFRRDLYAGHARPKTGHDRL